MRTSEGRIRASGGGIGLQASRVVASWEEGFNFPLLLLAFALPSVHSLLTLIAETLRLNFSAEFRTLTPSPRLNIHRRILQANLNVASFYCYISLSVVGPEVSLPIFFRCLFRSRLFFPVFFLLFFLFEKLRFVGKYCSSTYI